MTGSKADSFGDDPWIQTLKAYLLKLYERGDKLLGVCFGHQLLALVLGGKAERADRGWAWACTATPWLRMRHGWTRR